MEFTHPKLLKKSLTIKVHDSDMQIRIGDSLYIPPPEQVDAIIEAMQVCQRMMKADKVIWEMNFDEDRPLLWDMLTHEGKQRLVTQALLGKVEEEFSTIHEFIGEICKKL